LDGRGDLLELVSVLAGMVGAEQQLTAARELDPNVGLSTASVTAVQGCELRTGCDCSGHVRAFLGVASGDDDEFGIVYNNITSRLDIPGAASVRGLGRADMSTVCRNLGPSRRHRMYSTPNRFLVAPDGGAMLGRTAWSAPACRSRKVVCEATEHGPHPPSHPLGEGDLW
jgi:hypothetical protein